MSLIMKRREEITYYLMAYTLQQPNNNKYFESTYKEINNTLTYISSSAIAILCLKESYSNICAVGNSATVCNNLYYSRRICLQILNLTCSFATNNRLGFGCC